MSHLRCANCKAVHDEYDLSLDARCVDSGDRYQPAEYEYVCPACDGTDFDDYENGCDNLCGRDALANADLCAECWQIADPDDFADYVKTTAPDSLSV